MRGTKAKRLRAVSKLVVVAHSAEPDETKRTTTGRRYRAINKGPVVNDKGQVLYSRYTVVLDPRCERAIYQKMKELSRGS